jgi:hypothetical protein
MVPIKVVNPSIVTNSKEQLKWLIDHPRLK